MIWDSFGNAHSTSLGAYPSCGERFQVGWTYLIDLIDYGNGCFPAHAPKNDSISGRCLLNPSLAIRCLVRGAYFRIHIRIHETYIFFPRCFFGQHGFPHTNLHQDGCFSMSKPGLSDFPIHRWSYF
jgi:hypothetical protein